jgi:hypothetical protein
MEIAALTRQGLSPERALQAVDVQGAIARSNVIAELEAALGRAFAGVWFEPASAQLHVGVTSPASRRIAAAVVARQGVTADVALTSVRSTWVQLHAAQAQMNRKLAGLFAQGQVVTALSPKDNAVYVTLASAVHVQRRADLGRVASAAHVNVEVHVIPGARLVGRRAAPTTSCNRFEANKANCNPSLTSGVTITGPTTCTAGPMAIPRASKNETYLLTAGHCLKTGGVGSKWFAFNKAGTKIEIGPAAEFFDITKGDAGAIKITNPAWMTGKEKDPLLAVTAQWTKEPAEQEVSYPVEAERQPVQNATTCHEGQTTGESCGSIMNVSLSEVFLNDATGNEITEGLVQVLGARNAGGDSGGPWMFIENNASKTVRMEGTNVGFLPTSSLYDPFVLVYRLLTKLNLELLTTGNENRP